MASGISVSSDFDHGNIRVVKISADGVIDLEIEKDAAADYFQWFYFSVDGASNNPLTLNILNAGQASYPAGWQDYRAVASYDNENWFRVDTEYNDGILTIRHRAEGDRIYFAYFAPYPAASVEAFVAEMKAKPALKHKTLGATLNGQSIDCFSIGEGHLQYWVIARQHPGESMGSWWIEGFMRALLKREKAIIRFLSYVTVHIVPCMNPDGVRLGNLRTNAAGVDLNRAWRNATPASSPEVFYVRNEMHRTGVDFFIDIHGDETIANNFLDGAAGIPSWSIERQCEFDHFQGRILKISKDFQTQEGYPPSPPGRANLDIATNYVAETWGGLSVTLEMPFKDATVNPMPETGWSPERCKNFARELLSILVTPF